MADGGDPITNDDEAIIIFALSLASSMDGHQQVSNPNARGYRGCGHFRKTDSIEMVQKGAKDE
jgi:hypothetical protein